MLMPAASEAAKNCVSSPNWKVLELAQGIGKLEYNPREFLYRIVPVVGKTRNLDTRSSSKARSNFLKFVRQEKRSQRNEEKRNRRNTRRDANQAAIVASLANAVVRAADHCGVELAVVPLSALTPPPQMVSPDPEPQQQEEIIVATTKPHAQPKPGEPTEPKRKGGKFSKADFLEVGFWTKANMPTVLAQHRTHALTKLFIEQQTGHQLSVHDFQNLIIALNMQLPPDKQPLPPMTPELSLVLSLYKSLGFKLPEQHKELREHWDELPVLEKVAPPLPATPPVVPVTSNGPPTASTLQRQMPAGVR